MIINNVSAPQSEITSERATPECCFVHITVVIVTINIIIIVIKVFIISVVIIFFIQIGFPTSSSLYYCSYPNHQFQSHPPQY